MNYSSIKKLSIHTQNFIFPNAVPIKESKKAICFKYRLQANEYLSCWIPKKILDLWYVKMLDIASQYNMIYNFNGYISIGKLPKWYNPTVF